MGEHESAGLGDGVDDGLLVPGQQRAQVDHLAGNAQLLRLLHSLEKEQHDTVRQFSKQIMDL